MAEWTIYDKNGEERTVAQGVSTVSAKHYVQPDLEYSGTWMGDCFVTLNLRSAYPINFQIGDYVVYRGEKFVMNYDPSVVKKARRGTYGEGFTYDNVKFNALSYELTDMRMLDYVLYDNSVHYSSLPKFSFFCSDVDDLADRLQVNANRYCDDNNITESDRWIFITPSALRTQQRAEASHFPTADADTIYNFYFPTLSGDYEKVNQNVSIDNMTVWNACKYIKDTFGLNFIVRGRYVVIGAEGIPTEHFFRYGKGNGLYEIERHADEDQAVITKLYAYGSDKNLPTRYYANLNVTCGGTVTTVAKGGLTYNKLDIPYSASFFKTKTEVNDVECYAVRLTYNGNTYDAYVGSADVLEGVEPNTTNCSIVFTDGQNIPFGATNTVTFVGGINKDAWPVDHRTQPSGYALPDNMAVGNLMLPGFPTNSLKTWVLSNGGVQNSDGTVTWRGHTAYFSEDQYQPYILSRNADVLGIRESTKFFDGSDGDDEIYPTIDGTEAGVIYAAETIKDNGIFGEGAEVPNFTITLPDFGSGFDLKELLQSDTAIEMKNGYCGGRKFTVKSVTRNTDRTWACKCEREHDTALDLWFPYSYGMSIGNASAIADEPYQVTAGDKYVLTGIEMTDTYVEANAAVLLEAALAFLDKNDYVRYTYVPKIDELFMARQHDGWSRGKTSTYGQRSYYLTLKEGDTLLFEDNDLLISGAVYIDTLRIKEYGNGQIPTYEVTLRNDKQVGTVERIQEQINILNNTVANGTGGGGGVNVSLVRQLIQTYGAQSFLSKTSDDTANGLITFLKGARFGRFVTGQLAGTGAQIDSRGKIEAQALTLREYLEVPELRFNRAEIIAGNTTQTPCGGIIDTVTPDDTTDPPSGYATLKLEDGEIGKIAVGDLCMGYWHDMSGGNATTDSDDKQGRMAFSGFKTVYFMIDRIPELDNGKNNTDNHYFHYTLRPEGDDLAFAGGNGIHPFPMMHFAGRGNSDNEKPERQGFTIHTPNYTARLSGVNTWLFDTSNYTYVNGDLSGFGNLIGRPELSGFGTIDMNLYMKGHIIQVDNTPDVLTVSQSMMGLLNKFDTQVVTFKVMDGYRQDHTAAYNYRVTRSSGNPTADAMWASSHGNVGSSWTMSYADLGDSDLCEFTVEATATDMPMLSATFLARKNNNLRYFLTLNTDLIHIDMNGDVIGNGNEPTMTTGNDEGGESYLQLNGNYLTTGNSDNVYKIIARAWRVGASNTVIAESIDGLTIRATKYTGSVSESGGTSDSGRLDVDVDFSCDKYIIDLIDKNAVGVVYDVKTVLIVRDGSASVIADFDDEMGAGAATSDGTMLAGIPYTSVAHLYRGSAVQDLTNVELVNVNGVEMTNPLPSGWGYSEETEEGVTTKTFYLPDSEDLALKGKDITVSLSYSEGGQDATLTLSKLSKESRDNNRFGVRLTAGSEANTAYFYFNKFKAGSDGHVTLYQLAPDTTAIKVNKNGQYSTSTVTVGVLKIDVDETGQTETSLSYSDFGALGLSVYHKVDGQPSGWSDYEGSISVGRATTSVELKLEQTKDGETIEWDTETIPVVKDGLDSNYVMKFADSNYPPTAENIRDHYYDNFAEGRNWAIMSSDGGEHWNGPYPIVGEEGKPGDYTEFSFGISQFSIVMNTDADGCPDDLPAAGEEATQYGWSDGIIAVTTERPYLWMRTGKFVWNSALQSHTQQGSYTYARVKGLDAPDRYELEVSDTTFQIGQDDTTYTPSEIYVRGVVVKADGTRTYLVNNDWRNTQTAKNPVTTTITVTLSDGTTQTYTYTQIPTDALDSGRVKINALLSTENIDIADAKSISMKCDFKKNNVVVGSVTTTFNVVRNGRDGAIVALADFDDEMVSVPTDSTGKAKVPSSWVWQTTAHLYKGNEQLELDSSRCRIVSVTNHLWVNGSLTISSDMKTATLQVNGFDDMKPNSTVQSNTDNCKAVIELTSTDGSSGQATAYVNKIPSGEGSDAVYYNLVLSENAVHTTAQDAVTSSSEITIRAYKHIGDETPVLASDNTIIQVYGSNNAQTPIGSSTSGAYTLNVASPNTLSNYKVYLNLYDPNGGTIGLLLDQETIPVLKDGAQGQKGDDGDSIALEYSPNGTSNWNSTFRAGTDLYAREYKLDANGNRISGSEGAAFRIVGEQGIQGPDGKPGDYTDYSFGRSAQSTTTDSSTAPEIDGSWSDGVPVPSTAYPYIWMRKRLMTWDATRSQYVEVANTTRYIRVTGEKGDKGEDGKDAAAYEFTRFSDDARLVNGVWTGTFTGKSDAAIQAEAAEQGDKCNLLPNTDFAEWDTANQKPYGWSKNNGSESFSRANGWLSFNAPGGGNFYGLALNVETDDNGPMYLVPYDYNDTNRTRTISVRYYGSGQVMMGVHYYKWDGSNKQLSFVNNYQEWQYAYGAEIADGEEHLLTFTFDIQEQNATHLRILLTHKAGTGESSKTYSYYFSQPKIEVGDTATDYAVAPAWNPRLNGTVQGLWKGVMRWGYPYASTVFSDYEWTKVRDAEPRMTNWEDVTAIQRPTANPDDTTYERNHFLCGSYGERYYDMAYDGTDYCLCKKSYAYDFYVEVENNGVTERRYVTPSNTELWTIYWERASQFNFLMARTLFASRAYINQLGVEKLSTISQNGQVQVHDGVMEVFNAAGLVNIRFGLDANGYAVMQYFDNDGTLLYDLGPNGIASTELRQASVTRGTWYKLVEGTEFTNVLTQENIRRLFSTGITANTNYYYFLCKIVAGRKCADTATGDQGYISDDSMATPCDEHYFAKLESSSPKIRPQNYLSDGIYYNPTLTSFMRGGNGCRIRTFGGYGTPDAQYSNYASHYQAAGYAVTWPTSADDIMRNPLLYVEVYIVSGGKVSKTMKVFMRYDVYSNDDNITK